MRILLALCVTLLLGAAALSEQAGAGEKKEKFLPHSDADVEAATERFEREFAGKDMDARLRILNWYGQYRHKDVCKRLRKIWLKSRNVELQASAAKGLGEQLHDPKGASASLMQGIKKYEDYASRKNLDTEQEEVLQANEASVLTNALRSLTKLDVRPDKKGWKLIRGLLDHNHDDVAIAMLDWCGGTKEWRALKVILPWFEFYPDGYSWSGGSVSVDTGAAGTKDAKAAKAKFRAKYGGRAKKARPAAHAAMKKALLDITGEKFEKPDELKAWMKENKLLLKKNGA